MSMHTYTRREYRVYIERVTNLTRYNYGSLESVCASKAGDTGQSNDIHNITSAGDLIRQAFDLRGC